MIFMIGNRSYDITREDILAATSGAAPKPFDGRNKYYVELHGTRYPIKQTIHLATGLDYTRDFTAQYASRILTKLGFTVKRLPVRNGLSREPVLRTHAVEEGTLKFAVTLEPDEDGFIVVGVPALPGCYSQGRTEEEAITNIKEAVRGYIASMRRHGEEVPSIKEVREIEVAV